MLMNLYVHVVVIEAKLAILSWLIQVVVFLLLLAYHC